MTLALKILEDEKAKVFLPSSFSPNNDGVNDVLQLYGENIQEFNASIFDRWGGLLSTSTDPNNIWDGEANRSLVREGVYVIVIQYKLSEDQSPRYLSQNITVIR